MLRNCRVLAVLVGAVALPICSARAEDPQKLFESLFGQDVRKAMASPDPKDDAALAGSILDAARLLKDDPKSQTLFCEKAYEIGVRNPVGYATAIDAMSLLADKAPLKKTECQDKILEVRKLQYKNGTGAEKTSGGGALIDQSMAIGDLRVREGKWMEAVNLYREALAVATVIKSPRTDEIQAKIKTVTANHEMEQKIKYLEEEVKSNSDNKAAAKALLMIYLVDLDKPAEAAKLLAVDSDETLRKFVPLAAKGLSEVPEAGCLGLGEWYCKTLAPSAKSPGKSAMLSRAKAWYGRFLDLHGKQDSASLKVRMEVDRISKDLDELGVSTPAPAELLRAMTLDLGSSVSLKLVLISSGKFTMGSPAAEKDRESGETQHEVTITRAFYMGITEVTQDQYQLITGRNPSNPPRAGEYPVQMVSWEDASDFCKRLSLKTGKTVRLPTEAEWEYACRGGSKERFFFGDDERELASYAYIRINSEDRTHSVGRKKPNAWGLYDTYGNVWEWCTDWYGDYSKDAATDPTGPTTGTERVVRGGSLASSSLFCRSARRDKSAPDIRKHVIGFRVVVEAK